MLCVRKSDRNRCAGYAKSLVQKYDGDVIQACEANDAIKRNAATIAPGGHEEGYPWASLRTGAGSSTPRIQRAITAMAASDDPTGMAR